ncbi:MAG: Xaa-Pro peptidase family protein, partial [Deltaproteobacteria bacterium]|nr:Xaa-Pro peptidase family protein [Deltaproteobacteria bacterium]
MRTGKGNNNMNAAPIFKSDILRARTRRLQEKMRAQGVTGALIRQNADLYYFSGTMQEAYLFVPLSGAPLLMVRRNLARARAESFLENVIPLGGVREIPKTIAVHGYDIQGLLGLEMDVIPAKLYLYLRDDVFPGAEITDISHAIREVRMLKSPIEIEWLRQAAGQLNSVIKEVPDLLRPGMTELELSVELEYRLRRAGHQGFMRMRAWNQELFFGHILSGQSGAEPSYFKGATGGRGINPAFSQGASSKVISVGEPVSVDLGGCVNGYMTDQTRMFALGFLPDDLKRAYDAVLEIHYGLREKILVGETCGRIYEWAFDKAASLGYVDNFMGCGEAKMPFIGHGIGLEVDELPVFSARNPMLLEAGMTFAIEPKL